ncbi:MAG: cytochrome c biogenesis CcdA family protein [Thermomicrobiales bacterium]
METSIFFGGSVIAAFIAGIIALFAPCCISVMLPAYFASSFQNRRLLVAMTFLFAAGVATVILPIAMGAAVVRRLITTEHTTIYVTGGILMLALAAYILLGGQIHLPMPGRRPGGRTGPLSVYSLGIFSGVASACCAPVLAGVIALSGITSSFGLALGLGTAYVFGMVAPLFAISLLWERFSWRSSRLFRPRSFTWRVGSLRRTITATNLASGLLLALMGTGMVWLGLTSDAMPSPTGWQARLAGRLQHYGRVITDALAWLPGWAAGVMLLVVVALLARRALRQVGWTGQRDDAATEIEAAAEGGDQRGEEDTGLEERLDTGREILGHQRP